jgi:hypothetical protein
MYDADGPAEEIYGKLLREYLGPRPVRGFTKYVPRYGKQRIWFPSFCIVYIRVICIVPRWNSGWVG